MGTKIEILKEGAVEVTTVKKYKIGFVMFPFFVFDDKWIEIKSKQYGELRKKDSQCWFCKESFDKNQEMGLIHVKNYSNALSCLECALSVSDIIGTEIVKWNRK